MSKEIIAGILLLAVYFSLGEEVDSMEIERPKHGLSRYFACKVYKKAFLCIRKCMDLNYDYAVANDQCECSCHYAFRTLIPPELQPTAARWKQGLPSTRAMPGEKPVTEPVYVKELYGEDY